MGKQSMNRGLVFLLIFLVVVGFFILYTKMTFTGFVTNIPGGAVTSYNLADGTFAGAKIDNSTAPYAVVVDVSNNYTNGTYISPFVSAPSNIEAVWNNFAPNFSLPTNSTINYLARVCPDTNCTGVGFSSITPGGINLDGKYLQYEIYMTAAVTTSSTNVTNSTTNVTTTVSTTTVTSPKFYGADLTYLIPIALSLSIGNPQNTTYSNESVPVVITATNASSVWFSFDGGANVMYTAPVNQTFSQGAHSITAYANDTAGHLLSKTVSFAVLLPEPYCGDGVCKGAEVCANCPQDCGQCKEETSTSSSTDSTDLSTNTCTPDWKCDAWSECAGGTQTRACTDANSCGSTDKAPAQTQSCVVAPSTTAPAQTSSTNTNTNTKKGFFGTVGSVIAAPVTFVFSNSTRAFIFIAVLVLAVAGFFAYRTFVQGKKFPIDFKKLLSFGKSRSFDNMLE